jgi:hypothetical protein
MDLATSLLSPADCTATADVVCSARCAWRYLDADQDGYGDASVSGRICGEIPAIAVDDADDCDDADPGIGLVCDPFADDDGDGVLAGEDCDDTDPWSFPDAYDGCSALVDADCDGVERTDCVHDDLMYFIDWGASDNAFYGNYTPRPWQDARSVCQQMGGDLVVLDAVAEQQALAGTGNRRFDGWIGLNGEDGDWDWVDGTPFADGTANWANNHPGPVADCGRIGGPSSDRWLSGICTESYWSYCELDCETYFLDLDGDGVGRDGTARLFCGADKPGYVSRVGGDCDDLDADIGDTVWYVDEDGDGYHGTAFDQCAPPSGDAIDDRAALDCDETDPTLNPGNDLDVCNGLDDDCDGDVDENCPCSYSENAGSGYLFCGEAPVYWEDAARYCDNQGGSLVAIDDAAENAFVVGLLQDGNQSPWLGGSDAQSEGVWRWPDGTEVAYDNWHPGEPNNVGAGEHCMELRTDGAWNDAPCDRIKAFVCELPCQDWYADEDGDGFAGTQLVRTSCGVPNAQTSLVPGEDCDDTTRLRSPANAERCDAANLDEDCDGLADDADDGALGKLPYTVDGDGDGYGGATPTLLCDAPGGAVTDTSDCDDTTVTIGPDAPELCNGVDDDCDGRTDEDLVDGDGDGQCDLVDPCPGANPDDFDRDGVCDDAFHLSALGFWPGRPTTLIAANAPAGATVSFAASLEGEGSDACLLSASGALVCPGLARLVVLGSSVADAGGNAFLQVTTPSSFTPGTDVWLQALHVQGTGDVTPVMQQVVQEAAPVPYAVEAVGDNRVEVYVDGVWMGSSPRWQDPVTVAGVLTPGEHVLAARVVDTGVYGGFMATLHLDGAEVSFTGGDAWRVTTSAPSSDWASLGFDDTSWADAVPCTPLPWGYTIGSAGWVWSESTCRVSGELWFRKAFTVP